VGSWTRFLPNRFPARPGAVDYVCGAIVRLAQLSDSANRTFHLTAGAGNTLPLNELVEIYLRSVPLAREASTGTDRFAFASNGNSIPANHEVRRYGSVSRTTFPISLALRHSTPAPRIGRCRIYKAPSCREYLPAVVRYALQSAFASRLRIINRDRKP